MLSLFIAHSYGHKSPRLPRLAWGHQSVSGADGGRYSYPFWQPSSAVDAGILGDKREVGPGGIGLVGGALMVYTLQRMPLSGIRRLGYRNPILGDGNGV
jgi:hypothetical protein